MASLAMRGNGDFHSIVSLLNSKIQESGVSCELVDSVQKPFEGGSFCVMVFEKYYMRSSNRASLTVVVTAVGQEITVDAIGSGGGQGALLRFSWGAEEDFVCTVSDILKPLGFSISHT